ncbi:MAG: hypothetical protein II949_14960 [Prevotella sp.]|nr:hypothetical protein [Prevotella sp.]
MNKDNILGAAPIRNNAAAGGIRCLAPDTGPVGPTGWHGACPYTGGIACTLTLALSGQRAGTKATGRRRNVGNGPAPTFAANIRGQHPWPTLTANTGDIAWHLTPARVKSCRTVATSPGWSI